MIASFAEVSAADDRLVSGGVAQEEPFRARATPRIHRADRCAKDLAKRIVAQLAIPLGSGSVVGTNRDNHLPTLAHPAQRCDEFGKPAESALRKKTAKQAGEISPRGLTPASVRFQGLSFGADPQKPCAEGPSNSWRGPLDRGRVTNYPLSRVPPVAALRCKSAMHLRRGLFAFRVRTAQ
jgi:hypothetical protein